jgi:SEC-C motif-containing protein
MAQCPCCSGKLFSVCCSPFLNAEKLPETAVQLMRSRYTAYSLANINYIQQTMRGPAAENFVPEEAKQWAEQVTWRGLKIIDPGKQSKDIEYDEVEFAAQYVAENFLYILQERSQFKKIDNHWFYITGTLVPHQPIPIK